MSHEKIGIRVHRTYVSSRGEPINVENMTESHLVNTLGLHYKQLETMEKIDAAGYFTLSTYNRIVDTINVLSEELERRNLNERE